MLNASHQVVDSVSPFFSRRRRPVSCRFESTVARVLFDPAEYAYLPNICDEDELLTANAMGSAGWSVSLGIGAGLGGLTISELGVYQALWVDTLTFLVSALIFASLPPGGPEKEEGRESGFVTALSEIKNGWIHIIENSPIRRVVVAKAMWAAGGGAQVFLLILILVIDSGDDPQLNQSLT